MKKYFTIITLFLITACDMQEININDLNISENSHQFEIVVDCYITTELQHHYIKLIKPANYPNNTQLENISDATVTILSNSNIYIFSETDDKGVYISDDIFAPQVGEIYNLNIKTGNNEYFASDSIVAINEIDFLNSPLPQEDKNVSGNMIYFSGYRHSFGYDENTKWLWLYAMDTLENYNNPFSSDLVFNYTHIGGEPQGLFPDIIHGFGTAGAITDTITVRKYSISNKYHEYLLALFSETEWKTGIFSTISGNLPTNISEGGTGYFYIMDIKLKKIAISELLEHE